MIRAAVLLSCLALICAEEPLEERVIGGTDAKPNTWRWQVSLQLDFNSDGSFSHICGGSVIDGFHVLTAAHCILSEDAGQYRVVVGEYNLRELEGSEEFLGVKEIMVHPGWNKQLHNGNDIAMLKLAEPMYDNGFVELAGLPDPGEVLPHNSPCHVTGWGIMDADGTGPDILQEAPISTVEHAVCSQPAWWGGMVLESMVCAGGDGIISGCQGDSGGPLSCQVDGVWKVYGVVSFGPAGRCNLEKKPTVFTAVSSFIDWIYEIITEDQEV